ncbi:hypothetical protein [Vibrio crassostreae]|uniref:hypothetical protein n=1 Tax=Vibrio crassostreae TaxID=246167 RepID=UPI001B30B94A|nr:hypothetical protein [Vibrio crassostreae]
MLRKILPYCIAGALATSAYAQEDAFQCTEDELTEYMDNYNKGIETATTMTPTYDYNSFRKANMIKDINDPEKDQEESLCAVTIDPSFDVTKLYPDFSFLSDIHDAMKALFIADSVGGVDYSTLVSEAITAALAEAKEKAKEGMCKAARKTTSKIDPIANDLYKEAKKQGKQMVLDNEKVQELGIDNHDKPYWQQAAGHSIDENLDEYEDYAKWYEDGWSAGDATGSIVEKEIDTGRNDWVDSLDD